MIHVSLLYFDDKVQSGCSVTHRCMKFMNNDADEFVSVEARDKDGQKCDASEIFSEYYFISLPRFNDVVKSDLDQWLYFLKHSEMSVLSKSKAKGLEKAQNRLDAARLTGGDLRRYNLYVKDTLRDDACYASAIQEGLEKGKDQAKYDFALKMLNVGESIEKIAAYTELSIDEINNLIKKKT